MHLQKPGLDLHGSDMDILLLQVSGLSGAREVFTQESVCNSGPCTQIAVHGRLPRDELRCGPVPPVGVSSSPTRASAACQDLHFVLDVVEISSPLLFVDGTPPWISPGGTLTVGVAQGRVGKATYNVRVEDSSGAQGRFVSQVRECNVLSMSGMRNVRRSEEMV